MTAIKQKSNSNQNSGQILFETEIPFSFSFARDEREPLLAIAPAFDQSPSTTRDEKIKNTGLVVIRSTTFG